MSAKQILLIGRGGNGKTSCLETLNKLQRQNATLQISECDGVGDTGEDLNANIEDVLKNVECQIKKFQNYGGIDAFCFVLKYGVRYTQQEKNAVQTIKLIFGDDMFKNWGVIIFTYGDLFHAECPIDDSFSSFMDWCKEQTGDIQKLFKEVDYRVVLFNNRAPSVDKINQQVNELEEKIEQVVRKDRFHRYNIEKYLNLNAKDGRDELISRELRKKNKGQIPIYSQKEEYSTRKISYVSVYLLITWIFSLITNKLLSNPKHMLFRAKRIVKHAFKLIFATLKRLYNIMYAMFSCVIVIMKNIFNFLPGKVKLSEPKLP